MSGWKRITVAVTGGLVLGILTGGGWWMFGPVSVKDEPEVFVVPEKQEWWDTAAKLIEQKFIRSEMGFWILSGGRKIEPGGYRLNRNVSMWRIVKKLSGNPDLVWVTISYCLRREQIGEILAEKLRWGSLNLDRWNALDREGQFYPDTYLVPIGEPVEVTAQRFFNRFDEKTAPVMDKFLAQNILWTTGVKIASLIARESGGSADVKMISGIIWNRLNSGMRLQIDSTMQYTRGKAGGKWWGEIDLAEKRKDSPYNSYLYKGLPPTPICSPGIEAIEAAAEPAETDCLFYLHDHDKQIHCAKTYKEHLENIKKYLQ